jgi:hypothetical protein
MNSADRAAKAAAEQRRQAAEAEAARAAAEKSAAQTRKWAEIDRLAAQALASLESQGWPDPRLLSVTRQRRFRGPVTEERAAWLVTTRDWLGRDDWPQSEGVYLLSTGEFVYEPRWHGSTEPRRIADATHLHGMEDQVIDGLRSLIG